ncbi:MAG: hypothetical protein LBB23_01550 [Rickettsiales bacterium]|nr:hypothetical protein [Rickettsiales bacterium]
MVWENTNHPVRLRFATARHPAPGGELKGVAGGDHFFSPIPAFAGMTN